MSFTPGQGAVIAVGVDGAAASRRDIDSIGDALARLNASSVDRLGGQLTAAQSRIGSLGVSAAQTTAAMRGIPAQMSDIVASLQGGQAPLTVLLQQGGQLKDMFGGAGNAARALGGYVVGLINPFTVAAAAAAGLAYAYYKGAAEAKAYNQAIILSGNAAGTSASQLSEMARQIGAISGSRGAAAEALTALVSTSRVSADNLQRFATVAIGSQQVLGRSVADTVAEFAELGKAPLAALGKIDEKYHIISASTLAHIKALQDQGRTIEAASAAQNAFADGINSQRQKVLDSLTDWERGWIRIKNAVSGAVDATLNIGRGVTPVEKMNSLLDRHFAIQDKLAAATEKGDSRDAAHWQTVLESSAKVIATERAKGDALKETAKAQEKANEGEKLRKEWLGQSDILLTRAQLRERDLEATRTRATAAGLSEAEIQTQLAVVRRQYNDVYVEGIDLSIEALRRRAALEDVLSKRSAAEISAARSGGSLGEAAAIEATAAVELRAFDQSRTLLARELQLAASKINSLREQATLRGQLAVLDQQQLSRRIQLLNDLDAIETKVEDGVNDKIFQSVLARQASNDSLKIEYALYGKTSDAREAANVALKAETELQDYIFNQQKAGLPLSAEQIARLTLEKDARVAVTNATAGQSKALAYAAQLQSENERFETEYIFNATERAAAIVQIDDRMWQERIRLAGEGTDAQMKLQEQYNIWAKNQIAKPQLEEWKSSVEKYSDVFRTGFADMLNNGKDGWRSFTKSLTTTFKTSVADQIYKMFAQPFVVKMVASILGVSAGSTANMVQAASGTSQAAGGTGSYVSIAQSAQAAYSAISSGFANLSSSVADGVQVGMNATGLSSNILTNGPVAQAAGTAAGYAGGIAAGKIIGGAISGKYEIGGHGSAIVNIGTAAGAIFGGPIGAAIGGTIAGFLNRAFGMGPEEVRSRSLTGTLSNGSFSGTTNENWHQDGGWFRSDKDGVHQNPVDAAASNSLSNAYEQIKVASADFATTLGLDASSIASRSQAMNIAITTDAAANQKAVADFFIGVGDTIANELVPSISRFAKEGEAASATFQRIAGDYAFLDTALGAIGKQFGAVGLESVAARERLVDLAGGVDVVGRGAAFFAQNFLTEAERMAPIAEGVRKTMDSLNLSAVTTREQFKQVVLGLDLTSAQGAATFASLMKVEEAFAQVHPVVEETVSALRSAADILSEQKDLQKQYDQLTLTSAQLREKERLSIDASNLALFDSITQRQNVKATTDALQTMFDSLKSNRDGILSFTDSLKLGTLSTLTPMQKYLETERQYMASLDKARANPADSAAGSAAQAAATTFLTASQQINASSAAFIADRAQVLGDMSALADIAGAQMSDAQRQLALGGEQVTALATLNTTALGIQAAIVNLGAPGNTAAPTFDVQRYTAAANPGGDALVAEIKLLRAQVADLLQESKGRRADAVRQADDVAGAIEGMGQEIADGIDEAVAGVDWREQNQDRRQVR